MKIGILTFHRATNYGAILQAYGLVEYLKSIEHDVKIIDYKPKGMGQLYASVGFLSPVKVLKRLVLNVLMLPSLRKRFAKRTIFWNYTENELPLTHKVKAVKDLPAIDAYIVGSDQVWNVMFTGGVDRYYWGQFDRKNARLISYAGSAAENMEATFYTNNNAQLLNSFDSISVRENEIQSYLQKELPSKNIAKVLDPTLLAGRAIFENLIKDKCPYDRPYILIYQVIRTKDSLIQGYAKELSKKYKADIVEIKDSRLYVTTNGKSEVKDGYVNPTMFVALYKYASYVLTTSFHGTAFSLLFNRSFNVVSVTPEIDSRAKDILEQLNLGNRLINLPNEHYEASIDWSVVNQKLDDLREPSEQFLNNALKE